MSINQDDELVEVKLPKSDYLLLRKMIEERSAYSVLGAKLRSSVVWIVAGGLLSVFALWDYLKLLFVKV